MNIDATDIRILQLLQENAQLTLKEISQKINLSMTPTHDRIKRLEQENVIDKYVTILNKKMLGNPMMVYCNITLDKQQKNHFEEFEATIIQFPEVIECSVISGSFDYLLKVIVKDMKDRKSVV